MIYPKKNTDYRFPILHHVLQLTLENTSDFLHYNSFILYISQHCENTNNMINFHYKQEYHHGLDLRIPHNKLLLALAWEA